MKWKLYAKVTVSAHFFTSAEIVYLNDSLSRQTLIFGIQFTQIESEINVAERKRLLFSANVGCAGQNGQTESASI